MCFFGVCTITRWGWTGLLKPVIPRLQWPKPQYKGKRAITAEEHRTFIEAETAAAERNRGSRNSDRPHYDERRDFYELLWHTGAAQSDAAYLLSEDVDWRNQTLCYSRKKLKSRGTTIIKPALIRFGQEIAEILKRRPEKGALFPYLRTVRALKCGYPERFAQQALGHNSKAVHHAYAKNAEVTVPSLDDWEESFQKNNNQERPAKPKVVPVDFQNRSEPDQFESSSAAPVEGR